MSFNALSIAKLGIGFGALAVASIGLIAPDFSQAAGAGGGYATQHAKHKKLILVERINEFDDLVNQVQEIVKEQPKVKAKLRKSKDLKPESVSTDTAQLWLDYWSALFDSLRDQELANRLYSELEQTTELVNALILRSEMQQLLKSELLLQEEEEFMVLMLTVNA